jgi:hypothetical protein
MGMSGRGRHFAAHQGVKPQQESSILPPLNPTGYLKHSNHPEKAKNSLL